MGKKRKQFYGNHCADKRKKFNYGKLEVGAVGIMITHDRGKEHHCRNDAFRLLNYFADQWYGEEKNTESNVIPDQATGEHEISTAKSDLTGGLTLSTEGSSKIGKGICETNDDHSDIDDFDAALSKEVSSMKNAVSGKNRQQQRFSALSSGCNNIVFIKCVGISPSQFVQRIIETISLEKDNLPVARGVLRMHPADVSCKAHLYEIQQQAEDYLPKAFDALLARNKENENALSKQFNILYRGRNNEHLHMHDVIDAINSAAEVACPMWHYNCRYESIHLLVDVIKSVCTMAVVQGYTRHKKFNVRELFAIDNPETSVTSNSAPPLNVDVNPKTVQIAEVPAEEQSTKDSPVPKETINDITSDPVA